MTSVRPAPDATPAAWLLDAGVDWWDLVRFGPPGFEVYLRIALPTPAEADAASALQEPDPDPVAEALDLLAGHSRDPGSAYVAIWEGCGAGSGPPPDAPRLDVPNRAMLLFTGPVRRLRRAPGLAWDGSEDCRLEPHLVWPADRTWCLACEVDEEVEFTVGCSAEVAAALARAMPGRVREAAYGENAPLWREDR